MNRKIFTKEELVSIHKQLHHFESTNDNEAKKLFLSSFAENEVYMLQAIYDLGKLEDNITVDMLIDTIADLKKIPDSLLYCHEKLIGRDLSNTLAEAINKYNI